MSNSLINLEKDIYVGLLVNNVQRKIVAIKERENGDLIISLNRAEHYREIYVRGNNSTPKILHQKYSVHRSLKSTHDINTLTHTLKLSDEQVIETSHYTQAIKKFNRFAPIFSALSPSLVPAHYEIDSKKDNVMILGNHYPSTSLLFYMVCVSAKDAPEDFNLLKEAYIFSSKKIAFTYFDIHILWSFCEGVSTSDGSKIHFFTHKEKKEVLERERLRWLVEGLDSLGISKMFDTARNKLHAEYMELLLLDANSTEKAFFNGTSFIHAAEDIFQDIRKESKKLRRFLNSQR